MQRIPYPYDTGNFADGQGVTPQYYYVPKPMVPDSLRHSMYTPGYSDGYSSDAAYGRPTVLAPCSYKPTRSRRWPTKLCLPVVSRPEPRRRLPTVSVLSDDLSMYDEDDGEYAWPASYQQQGIVYAPARPLRTERQVLAPLAVPEAVAAQRAPTQPMYLHVAGHQLVKPSSGLKNRKEAKLPKRASRVKNTKSDHEMGGSVQGHSSQHKIEEQSETQQTHSEAEACTNISSSAIRDLNTVQENKMPQEATSQCTSTVQLNAGEAIEAVHSSSYTNLCMKPPPTLTDKLHVLQSSQEQPESIKTLTQLRRDLVENIHRETGMLLQIYKYMEDNQNAHITPSSPKP